MKRGEPPKRKTPLKRTQLKPRAHPIRRKARVSRSHHELWMEAELMSAWLAKNAARAQRVCQNPDCTTPKAHWQAHHVTYEQEVRRLGLPRWNTENVLRLCEDCHRRHHQRIAPIPMTALRTCNFAYAFRVMGPRAADYLRRRYAGDDKRIDWYLGALEHGKAF